MASAPVKEVGTSSRVLKQMAGTLWLIGSCFQNVDQSLWGLETGSGGGWLDSGVGS